MDGTTPKITSEMLAGWTWDKNVLRAPNGRIHVVCERRQNTSWGRSDVHTVWNAHVVCTPRKVETASWRYLDGSAGPSGHASGEPSRHEAAVAAVDSIFQAKDSRLPAVEDVAGLHPAFATLLFATQSQRTLDAAKRAHDTAIATLDELRAQLARLPGEIAKLESSIPGLRSALIGAQATVDAIREPVAHEEAV